MFKDLIGDNVIERVVREGELIAIAADVLDPVLCRSQLEIKSDDVTRDIRKVATILCPDI